MSLPALAPAQEAGLTEGLLDLEVVVAEAIAANPESAAARQRWIAASATPSGLRSLPDPMVRFGLYAVPIGSIDPLAGELRLQLQQQFPYPGKLDRRATVAEREAERVGHDVARSAAEIAAAARHAYWDLWFAERAGAIHHGHLELVRQLTDATEERYASGTSPQENVLRALQELTGLLTELAAVERDVATARVALNRVLHRAPTAPLGSARAPRLDQLDELTLERLLEAAETLNPLLAASRAAIERERARIERARHERKPDFGVMAEWWTASDGMGGRFERYALLGTMTLPWLHQGKYVAAIEEAVAMRAAAEADRRAARDRVLEGVASAWERARAAERIAELYRTTLLPQSEQAMAASRAAYEASQAEFISVVDSERTLLLNRLGLARIEADYGHAIADLVAAIGITRMEEIEAPVAPEPASPLGPPPGAGGRS